MAQEVPPKFKPSDLDNIHPTTEFFHERKHEAWQTYYETVVCDKSAAGNKAGHYASWRYFIEFSEEAVRRLHEQQIKIQSLETQLKRSRDDGNPSTPSLSLAPSAASFISITPVNTEGGVPPPTNIQLSTSPSHLTLTIVTPTSSSVSISHGSGGILTLGQGELTQRVKNLQDSVDERAKTTADAPTSTPTAETTTGSTTPTANVSITPATTRPPTPEVTRATTTNNPQWANGYLELKCPSCPAKFPSAFEYGMHRKCSWTCWQPPSASVLQRA
ncbi:hypothetical protein QBC41DRAFT_302311 [Cercophora samala]|uniref:Uncharacterized protein n=1 Tax=Cercophora samala TaxID=330535 RepID=A0AA39ZEQ4_9PEZI|nr:hypothetical protein QBC41DRAFT_302311 [Cercophora samala]